jgi:crotonobetainyl-CoA:carnitine CoA-transferase CaiB-like acyl-CoA transferase
MADKNALPYSGIRVIEFTHMVMGPTCGMILADLGAEVIKVEPIDGDKTRRLLGSGAGFFPMFNRNKKSLSVDMKTPEGMEIIKKLISSADVVSENFKPGTMAKMGLDYETLHPSHPKLIYVSHKGFLPGPYDHRTALDEVVQMMGGLAYMTGPEDRPLRAGSSVNDIMGGIFGAIGVMAALRQRESTGVGQEIQSSLYENNIFLVGQHMMQYAVTGKAAKPMPNRISAWAIYDVFEVADGEKIFLAVVSDTQWKIFCDAFKFDDLYGDQTLATNNLRVVARPTLKRGCINTLLPKLAPSLNRMDFPLPPSRGQISYLKILIY